MFPRYSWLKDPVNFSVSNSYLAPDLVEQVFTFQKKSSVYEDSGNRKSWIQVEHIRRGGSGSKVRD